jgi:hypothetical protein
MRKAILLLGSAAFLAAAPASAAIILTDGNVPGSLSTVHLDGNITPSLVRGDVNGLFVVNIQGTEAIHPSNDGNGQPWVVADDGILHTITFSLLSGYTFNAIEFNLVPFDARGNPTWTATLTGVSPDGTKSEDFDIKGKNFFNAYTTDGWRFTSVSFDTATDLQGVGQIRIGGVAASVPEPASWAMMTIGFGILGFGLRGQRKKGQVTFG